jgi:hypothetical protein
LGILREKQNARNLNNILRGCITREKELVKEDENKEGTDEYLHEAILPPTLLANFFRGVSSSLYFVLNPALLAGGFSPDFRLRLVPGSAYS